MKRSKRGFGIGLAIGLIGLSGCALAQSSPPAVPAPAAATAPQSGPVVPAAFARLDEHPNGTYKLDLTHASILWKVRHFGLSTYVGRFNKFDAAIQWDNANVANNSVKVTIDPASLDTDYPNAKEKDFNKELAERDNFFNVKNFKDITFVSTKVERDSDNHGLVTGDLTLLGVTKPVVLDVTFNGGRRQPFGVKHVMGFSATTKINRSEWGMKALIPAVSDEVRIEIEGEFVKE